MPLETTTAAPATYRVFVSLPVPHQIGERVRESFAHFAHVIREPVPIPRWHVTLAWLGEVYNPKQYYSRLTKPLGHSFVPTVRILHVGRGRNREQLWAYVEPANNLLAIRDELTRRLKTMRFQFPDEMRQQPFIPHITVAKLYDHAGRLGLADYPTPCSFAVKEAHVWRSDLTPQGAVHSLEATIPLV